MSGTLWRTFHIAVALSHTQLFEKNFSAPTVLSPCNEAVGSKSEEQSCLTNKFAFDRSAGC